MGRKSTKLEVQARVDACYKFLASGWKRGEIVQYSAENWDLRDRQTDELISRARERLLHDAELSRPSWLAEALGRLKTYERAAYEKGQLNTAIQSVQTQAKLIGMDV